MTPLESESPPRICSLNLVVRPCELTHANAFVATHHRHHRAIQGHRFSLSAWAGDSLVGVAVVGHPVGRLAGHPLEVVEVTRLCTDGTPNACSALYGAAARVARDLGYARIQTYILDSEPGTSLKAAGWTHEGAAGGGSWARPKQGAKRTGAGTSDHPQVTKQKWAKNFRPVEEPRTFLAAPSDAIQEVLL